MKPYVDSNKEYVVIGLEFNGIRLPIIQMSPAEAKELNTELSVAVLADMVNSQDNDKNIMLPEISNININIQSTDRIDARISLIARSYADDIHKAYTDPAKAAVYTNGTYPTINPSGNLSIPNNNGTFLGIAKDEGEDDTK